METAVKLSNEPPEALFGLSYQLVRIVATGQRVTGNDKITIATNFVQSLPLSDIMLEGFTSKRDYQDSTFTLAILPCQLYYWVTVREVCCSLRYK